MAPETKRLHWSQRIALARHNLHSAHRSGDYHFFKSLQAAEFVAGINHVAAFLDQVGDDGDFVASAIDNLSAGLAYTYQDAFMHVYNNLKSNLQDDFDRSVVKSRLYSDITQQKNVVDMAIDKMVSSVTDLIQQQPEQAQELATSVWITGTTIVADCFQDSLNQMDTLDQKMDDLERLERSWNTVKSAVVSSVTGLKCVFNLMDPSSQLDQPRTPVSSNRSSSIANASGAVFRRLSVVFNPSSSSSQSHTPPVSPNTNLAVSIPAYLTMHPSPSTAPVYRTPDYLRGTSQRCPTAVTAGPRFEKHKLDTISPTPALDIANPFDTSVAPAERVSIEPIEEVGPTEVVPVPLSWLETGQRVGQVVV